MKTNWKVIDIVAACIENNIRINFQPEKRFYRIRFKDCCGIFDMRSHCFLTTSAVIFSSEFELQYKKAENNLEAIEELMDEFGGYFLPPLDDLNWRTVTQPRYA
ncbi:MAG: hypothetical protein ACO1NO_10235 [Burkholderiaceae bacterium]